MKTTTGILLFLVIMVCSALTSPGQTPGDLKWKFTTGDRVWSSPAIAADGTIYIGSEDGRLYAIHPNGIEKWRFTTGGFVFSSPAVALDGTVYVAATDGFLYAVRPSDGSQKWSVNIGSDIFSSPAVAIDGTIYIAAEDGFLYAVGSTARGGFIKWSFPAGVQKAAVLTSSPAVGLDGTIYVAGSSSQTLFAVSPSGAQLWSRSIGSTMESSPTVAADGTIYLGTDDGNLFAFWPNGNTRWTFTAPTEKVKSSAVLAPDGTIYASSDDTHLYAVNPNGNSRWTFTDPPEDLCASVAVAADGDIYVPMFAGPVNAFGIVFGLDADGILKWSFDDNQMLGGVYSSPAIAPDGTLYFGSINNSVYALHETDDLANSPWPMFRRGVRQRANATDQYQITEIGTLGGWYSSGAEVNGPGTVCGSAQTGYLSYDGLNPAQHAFRWQNGTLWELGWLWSQYENNYARGINDSTVIVGHAEYFGSERGFRWTQSGGLVQLGTLSGNTVAAAINNDGFIVGTSINSSGNPEAVLWSPGQTSANPWGSLSGVGGTSHASAINADERVAGRSINSDGVLRAYLTQALQTISPADDLGSIAGGQFDPSEAHDVNDLGEVVGGSDIASGQGQAYHAFFKHAGTGMNAGFIDIGTLPGHDESLAYGINNVQQVVGESYPDTGTVANAQPFLWREGWPAPLALNDLLPAGHGWDLVSAVQINDSGEITGWGYNPGQIPHAFVLRPDF